MVNSLSNLVLHANPLKIAPSEPNEWLYQTATQAFSRTDRWTGKAREIRERAQQVSFIPRVLGRIQSSLLQFATEWTKQDYNQLCPIKVGNKTVFHIMNIPIGSLLFLLYGCTIPPRVFQAYQRGKKDNDYREVGDVLRRDLLALTFLLFALGNVTRYMGQRVQNKRGVVLINPKTKEMLPYSSFHNYRIDSIPALKAILSEGNARGLRNAVKGLHDHGVAHTTGDLRLEKALNDLNSEVEILTKIWQAIHEKKSLPTLQELSPSDLTPEAIDKRIETVFKAFQTADAVRVRVRDAMVRNVPNPKELRIIQDLGVEIIAVLEKYAKTSRLPSDIVSFVLASLLTGFLPVWMNKQWNLYQFNRKQRQVEAEAAISSSPCHSQAGLLNA